MREVVRRKTWAVVVCFFFLCMAGTLAVGSYVCLKPIWHKAKPLVISLPQFQGRILPQEQVQPATFTITKPFEEIGQWGKDSILSFGRRGNSSISFCAWRPDQSTPGVFEYAEKNYPTDWPIFYAIRDIKREGNEIVALPTSQPSERIVIGFFTIIVALVFLLFSVWAAEKSSY